DWSGAAVAPLAGDASNRRYLRLDHTHHGAAVLMDANPNLGEDVRPFIDVGSYLVQSGLSGPKVFAKDPSNGFLILEDLGDDLFDRVVAQNPALETELYLAAWDVLFQIWKTPHNVCVSPYDPAEMVEKAALIAEWYDADLSTKRIKDALGRVLKSLDWAHPTLALRDYHAQNLIWLPDRKGPARVGLLDFQDAQPSHVLYDVISYLFDARRDVSDATRTAVLEKVKHDTQLADFDIAVPALLAQRSMRILGVFARLSLRDKKTGYVDLIPRVYQQLQFALRHPSLADLRSELADLNAPTLEYLTRLKDQS
ncbi:MAG: phosphotransferase, partial [Pseudomonadota bacterium]